MCGCRASPGSGSRGLGTTCRAKVRAVRVPRLGRKRVPLRLKRQHRHNQNPPTHLRLAASACTEVRAGGQNWQLAAGVAAAARARLGPAAKQILPAPTGVAPGSDSRTPGHSHAHTFTRSLTHTHSPQVQNRPVPWRVAGWRSARRSAGGTFRRSVGSPGSSELLPRPWQPPAPESRTGARGKALGASGAPARPSPPPTPPTPPPRARHPELGRRAERPRGPREPEGCSAQTRGGK